MKLFAPVPKLKFFGLVSRAKVSLVFFFALLAAYFFLSGGNLFIPQQAIFSLSFGWGALHNAFFFEFVQKSLFHLTANIVSFLFFALIVELALSGLDVLLVFFFASIASALVFLLLNPSTVLFGSSAGVSGLLGVAAVLSPRKTAAAIIAVVLLLNFLVVPFVSETLKAEEARLQEKQGLLEKDLNRALAGGDKNRVAAIKEQLAEANEKAAKFDLGKLFDAVTGTDFWIHGLGAFFGLAYLFFFRREKFWHALKEISGKVKKYKSGRH